MLNDLAREIRDEIIDKINEMDREENFDMNDFAFQLWEEENVNGTCTFSTIESMEWIKTHFYNICGYVQETCEVNPFLMPERFQVIMSIEVTLNLLSQIWEDGLSKKEIISRLEELS